MEEGHPAGPGDAIVPESAAQTSKWRPQHRSGVRGPVPFLLALLLLAPTLPRAAAVPPTDLSILFDGTPDTVVYVNGSTVEASAILNFTGPPDPPPLLGDIAFQWGAPNGTVVATATVHPDANGSAISAYRVALEGSWSVNATYLGTPALWRNHTFGVAPDTWSGAPVILPKSTMVGRNATLTIAAGMTVMFDPGASLRIKGTVAAVGTTPSPILFTANSSSPVPGFWGSLVFLPESANGSVLDQVRVQYCTDGITIAGGDPRIDHAFVADASGDGFRVVNTTVTMLDIGATRATNGLRIENSTLAVDTAAFLHSKTGILGFGGSGDLRNVTFDNASWAGIRASGAAITVRDSAFGGGGASGLDLTNALVHGERLSFASLQNGVRADGPGTSATFGNSSFGSATVRDFLVINGARVAVINGTFPPGGERGSLTTDSQVTLWNYLTTVVVNYDANNATLAGATVDVFSNKTRVSRAITGANGTIPDQLLLYRRYADAFSQPTVRVLVNLSGYAFAFNNRSLIMDQATTARFQGSVADLDHDGDPDFSDLDIDGDGLTNSAEFALGTNPRNWDTDGDGMPDGWEFDHQLRPRDASDRTEDPDGDGLGNYAEYVLGTDPRSADTDGDGMPDGWEVQYQLYPTNATDADRDADGDGFTNLQEFLAGTNPQDPGSYPRPNDYTAAWSFLVGVIAALAIILLSWTLVRRNRRRRETPHVKQDDAPADEDAPPRQP